MMDPAIEFLLAGQRFGQQKLLAEQLRKRNPAEPTSKAPEKLTTTHTYVALGRHTSVHKHKLVAVEEHAAEVREVVLFDVYRRGGAFVPCRVAAERQSIGGVDSLIRF